MIDKEQVAGFLASGVGVTEIAAAVGCDPSFITQLKHDPEIQALIEQHKHDITVADVKFDKTLESAEEKALNRIDQMLPFANLQQSLSAFRILNGARKRKDGPQDSTRAGVQVTLILPVQHIPKYVTNQTNEIIEVEGRTMISASPKSLDTLLTEKAGKELKHEATQAPVERAARLLGALSPVAPENRRAPRQSPISVENL